MPHAQDITLGKPAKAQLAKKVDSPEQAFALMKGKAFVVETKFDGRRPGCTCTLTTAAPLTRLCACCM